jgi:predicted glycosyltransferase
MTGLGEAAWMVPPECESLHLPSWDSLISERAAARGRPPWLNVPAEEAVRFRCELIQSVFHAFQPDAVFVDYLPFGLWHELRRPLETCSARTYFVHRGIIDESDRPILYGEAANVLSEVFDRILVAADRRIVDVTRECALTPATAAKVTYTGYLAPSTAGVREELRCRRALGSGDRWVVCSAGSGLRAERFLQHCVTVAARMPETQFDVVFGSRGRADLVRCDQPPPNCRVSYSRSDLPELHAAADVAVTSGGYNSLVEAAVGGARLLVRPVNNAEGDEQRIQTLRFRDHYPVHLLEHDEELEDALQAALIDARHSSRPTFPLDIRGVENIREIALKDLGVH